MERRGDFRGVVASRALLGRALIPQFLARLAAAYRSSAYLTGWWPKSHCLCLGPSSRSVFLFDPALGTGDGNGLCLADSQRDDRTTTGSWRGVGAHWHLRSAARIL